MADLLVITVHMPEQSMRRRYEAEIWTYIQWCKTDFMMPINIQYDALHSTMFFLSWYSPQQSQVLENRNL